MIAADTITKGQTFRTKYDTLTAVENVTVDEANELGGYKVLVTDGGEEFFHLFGLTDMVTAA
ncbi:MAG: hypothetical protein M3536_00930 [Actinomycetota bacterium]|nr:hypothetical protein [Actinomycetota bacterium]